MIEESVDLDWKDICSADDLQINSGVCALVGDAPVAIFYVPSSDKKVFAIGNYDPIGKAYVMSRGIVGDLNGELVVASPLYKQHFSLATGACVEQEVSIPTYPIRIVGDMVQIGL
jgi:nitrite reductase (NADH) small subunit